MSQGMFDDDTFDPKADANDPVSGFEGARELQSMTAEELDTTSSIFSNPRMYARAINTFHS